MCYNWRGDKMKNNEEIKKDTKKASSSKKETTKKQNTKTTTAKKTTTSSKKNTTASTQSKKKSETAKKETVKKTSPKTEVNKKTEKKVTKPSTKTDEKVKKIDSKEKNVAENQDVKKENNQTNNLNVQENFVTKDEIRKVGVVVAVIAVAFSIFFVASKLMNKNNHKDIFKESLDVAEIQYKDILISKLLKQKPNEYYVLVEYSKDENLSTYEGYITNYEENYSKGNVLKIYTAQLDNAFNKSYYSDEDSYESDKLSFSKTTLVKVTNGNITETYTENDISVKIQGLIGEASN